MVYGVSYHIVGRADCPYFARAERLATVRQTEREREEREEREERNNKIQASKKRRKHAFANVGCLTMKQSITSLTINHVCRFVFVHASLLSFFFFFLFFSAPSDVEGFIGADRS